MATKMLGGQPVSTSDYNRAAYGTAIPNVEQRRAREAMDRDALIAQEIKERGGSLPLDGLNESGQPVSTLGMTDKEKFFAVGRMKDAMSREEARRKPIDQFGQALNTSVAFGGESALLTPEGRTRAMKQGVAAGLSYKEAEAAVQGAFDFLNSRYGKKDAAPAAVTPSVGVPPLLAKPEEGTVNTSTASTTTQLPPPTTKRTTPPREYGATDLGQDVLGAVGLKQFPKGSEEAVKGAYDALRNLGRTPRVTDEERKKFEDLQSKFKIQPEKYKTEFDKMQYDIKTREDLYGAYDTARNKLIESINPYVSATEATPEPPSPTSRGMGYQPIKSRKQDTIEKINDVLRKRRMEQQYGPQ